MLRRTGLVGICLILGINSADSQSLPGTRLWDELGTPSSDMVAGLHRFLDRETALSRDRRPSHWKRDFSSDEAYERSVASNRKRLAQILGVVDPRPARVEVEFVATPEKPALLAESGAVKVFAVRWDVFDDAKAEGLLLDPVETPRGVAVVIGDADTSPEVLAGVAEGLPPDGQVARVLAEQGFRVLVPTLIDRSTEFSGDPKVRFTNLTHREWIYRMAFETGRHLIGYEVATVSAAIDWLDRGGSPRVPTVVVGHGEGGLIALASAALDTRIQATWVGGFFGPREGVWSEPVYRNVWGLLEQFGGAEIASLVAPRTLLIEACRGPEVDGPPPPVNGRSDAAVGRLATPELTAVRDEFERLKGLVRGLKSAERSLVLVAGETGREGINESGRPGLEFLRLLKMEPRSPRPKPMLVHRGASEDGRLRMGRLVRQMVEHTQRLVRTSELRRYARWTKADPGSLSRWEETTEPFRQELWDEVIGRFPAASEPLDARSRMVYDQPLWRGYAVEIPVWPDVVASGVLLLPKDLQPGEKRPVVVCQHGLEGTPEPIVDPGVSSVYNSYGARLADRGYIVYAPQNPYIGKDDFRNLQRKALPLKRSLFAVIVRQHERTLEWLKSQPWVDPGRIAFYGLSYGGKTAMRVPALLKDYCLSICSADFNEWVVKCTNVDRSYSYMYTIEHDMYEFGLSEGYNYAEMAALIAPRPFMVERGHKDGVAPDEWVNYEFAKVRRTYADLGIPERTHIAHFQGGHMIEGTETFAFLAHHLRWPRGAQPAGR